MGFLVEDHAGEKKKHGKGICPLLLPILTTLVFIALTIPYYYYYYYYYFGTTADSIQGQTCLGSALPLNPHPHLFAFLLFQIRSYTFA
jgi:hypothetical protein